jgi:NTP pyrophosphatase (non-canonical NTP hydrolase)
MTSPWDFSTEIEEIVRFRDSRNWKQFNYPKDLATAISIEAAELQELFLWKGQELPQQLAKDDNRMNDISDEIADVVIYSLLFSYDCGIDLREAIKRKMKKNAEKYPLDSSR